MLAPPSSHSGNGSEEDYFCLLFIIKKNLDRTQVQVKRKNHGPVLKIELPKQGA